MRKLSSILIEILVRPPGFHIQLALVQVFIKVKSAIIPYSWIQALIPLTLRLTFCFYVLCKSRPFILQILKIYDELLTWACTYITEVLKRTSEMASVDINDEYKCLLHGALLLANGLEFLDIKVAHEFGWDSSIAEIKRNHYQSKKASVNNRAENTDTFLEDEFNVGVI